jgi:hypothetical protein
MRAKFDNNASNLDGRPKRELLATNFRLNIGARN